MKLDFYYTYFIYTFLCRFVNQRVLRHIRDRNINYNTNILKFYLYFL